MISKLFGLDKQGLKLWLEKVDAWLDAILRYLMIIVLAFGVGAAFFSFLSGERASALLATAEGTNIINGIVVISVIVIWREVREIRRWLEGISRGHSKRIYSRLNEKQKA